MCVYVCICVCMYMCICMFMYVCVCVYVCVSMYVYVCMYYICMLYVHTHACMQNVLPSSDFRIYLTHAKMTYIRFGKMNRF